MTITRVMAAFLVATCMAAPASAQDTTKPSAAAVATAASDNAQSGAPAPLTVYFEAGSSAIRSKDRDVLDKASRAFSEGKPIVMTLTGSADRTGQAEDNLELSHRRAAAVLEGLIDRGIPADRFQVLSKGETELPVPTAQGVAEPKNRRVDITWR